MKISIIGCGNMGQAMARRLSQKNHLFFYDRHPEKAEVLAKEGFGEACNEISHALHSSEIIILAVKPQNLKEIAPKIKESLKKEQVIVSLLAQTSLSTLSQYFQAVPIIRMMPNLPIICGEGVIGLSSKEENELIVNTFETLGKVYWIPEEKMDALTALTGSGPAFFFTMVEAMVDAGIAMGFSSKEAQGLVYQMLQGSLTLLKKTDKHPGELRWNIASPQGTTIAGLKRLEELALRGGIINTFLAAYDHAKT